MTRAASESTQAPNAKGQKPPPRTSRSGRRRAWVLLLVHALIALHIAHWLTNGTTLSPLEPSEAMEFSKVGLINAGFVFFGLTIASTLVLGRWFCGWACHLVALQDASLWLLKKLGIRPKPFRSRLLGLVPLAAAYYMFLHPLVYRWWAGHALGVHEVELTKAGFWDTFPPWPIALLTFAVCGGIIIYFLGAKGFCTYACPYGAFFGLADKLAPGRIRVTDACAGCGHCTVACTSNVRVHEEVRDYGMVVDPGCMKCLDCVSVCPTNALYFGFGKPSLLAKPRRERSARRPQLGWGEELLAALVFVVALFVVRGLYGLIPFLLALGIAGILAFLYLLAWRIFRRPNLGLADLTLRRGGRLRPAGMVFLVLLVPLTGGLAHAGAIQLHDYLRADLFTELDGLRHEFVDDPERTLSEAELERVERARAYGRFVERHGWLSTPGNARELAWLELLAGYEERFQEIFAELDRNAEGGHGPQPDWLERARWAEARGQWAQAIELCERFLEHNSSAAAFGQLARLHRKAGNPAEALNVYVRGAQAHPQSPDLQFNLGVSLAMVGRPDAAIEAFRAVLALDEERRDARENLAGMLCQTGRLEEGIEHYRIALAAEPGDLATLELLAQALLAVGDKPAAQREVETALARQPGNARLRALLAQIQRLP